MNRFTKRVLCSALVFPIVAAGSLAAQGFGVDGDGNVDAASFSGDGSGLTGVPTTITHAYFEQDCPSGNTCVVTTDCPGGLQVSGGGLFINNANQSLRSQVVLHQTYRATVTQWTVEATNDSAQTLGFGVTPECVLAPAAPDQGVAEPRHPFDHYQLLICPKGDHSKYITREEAKQPHYCPGDGEQMIARWIELYPIAGSDTDEDREADGRE